MLWIARTSWVESLGPVIGRKIRNTTAGHEPWKCGASRIAGWRASPSYGGIIPALPSKPLYKKGQVSSEFPKFVLGSHCSTRSAPDVLKNAFHQIHRCSPTRRCWRRSQPRNLCIAHWQRFWNPHCAFRIHPVGRQCCSCWRHHLLARRHVCAVEKHPVLEEWYQDGTHYGEALQ